VFFSNEVDSPLQAFNYDSIANLGMFHVDHELKPNRTKETYRKGKKVSYDDLGADGIIKGITIWRLLGI
jgi:hypothetical protein